MQYGPRLGCSHCASALDSSLLAQAIIDDPMSEEQQGRNLAKAAHDAGTVEVFIWGTMPSSHALSGGKFFTRLYEGKWKRHCASGAKL